MNFKSATGTLSRRRLVNCCKLVIHFSILCSILLHSNGLQPMFELTKRDFVTVSFGISKWKRQNILIFIQVTISRHSTSLGNCQPFNLAGDSPKNSPRDPIGNFIPSDKYYGDFAVFHESGLTIGDTHFIPWDVPALGNCFYLSLALSLNHCYGEETRGSVLRQTVIDSINSIKNPIMELFCFQRNIKFPVPDSVLDNWRNESEYVEFEQVAFASHVLQVRIIVYEAGSLQIRMDTGGLFPLTDRVVHVLYFKHQSPFEASGFNHYCALLPVSSFPPSAPTLPGSGDKSNIGDVIFSLPTLPSIEPLPSTVLQQLKNIDLTNSLQVSSQEVRSDSSSSSQGSTSSLAWKHGKKLVCPVPSCSKHIKLKTYKRRSAFVKKGSLSEHLNTHILSKSLTILEKDFLKALCAVQCKLCNLLMSEKNKTNDVCDSCSFVTVSSSDELEAVIEEVVAARSTLSPLNNRDLTLTERLRNWDLSQLKMNLILNGEYRISDVPRRVHNLWSRCVLEACKLQDLQAVKILLILPRMVLRTDSWESEDRMLKFLAGDLDSLVHSTKTNQRPGLSNHSPISHCEFLIHKNRYHDAWKSLFSGQEPADLNAETKDSLQKLHPAASPSNPKDDEIIQEFLLHNPGPDTSKKTPISVSSDLLITVLKSFKKAVLPEGRL
jgi:hypothetical protein